LTEVKALDQVRQKAYDCILPKQFKDIRVFNTKIRDQVTTTKPKPQAKSKSKPSTSSESVNTHIPYKGVFVPQLKLLLANRKIKYNSKMNRAELVALAITSDSVDNNPQSAYNMHDEIDNNPREDDSTDNTGAGSENDNVGNTQRASSATPDDLEYIKTLMVLLFITF
jgi:hypothetical protein